MPSTLIELGFISNPEEAALMSEEPERFARGIYRGLQEYFGML
jgi:N-acetylmuramoyl-L-alanine amidase